MAQHNDGQTATSHERCSSPRQRHTQVRPWTVTSSTRRLAPTRCGSLHWLDVADHVKFKLGRTVHQCLSNKAPHYLADSCTLVFNIASRRRLRSAHRRHLAVPRYNCSTLGRRSFSVAGPAVWNLLPDDLRDQGCEAVQKAHSNSRWRHTFSRSISMQSALDMLMSMRYTNLCFIIIVNPSKSLMHEW